MTNRILVVAFLALMACRKETITPAPPKKTEPVATTTVSAPPRDLKGQNVDTTVRLQPPPVSGCDVKPAFAAGEPVDFTMHLVDAPEKLTVSVRILQGEEEVGLVRQPAEGKKVVTLRLPKLKPGTYKLEGLWGGNRACEKEIEITK